MDKNKDFTNSLLMKCFFILVGVLMITLILKTLFLYSQSPNPKEKITNSTQQIDVREIAWRHIPKQELPHIQGTWRDATIMKRKLEQFHFKEVYIVSFPTDDNPSVGDYSIYISIKDKKFLGIGLRD